MTDDAIRERIAEAIDRAIYEHAMVCGESPPEPGSMQSGRDWGISYGLREAADIARSTR